MLGKSNASVDGDGNVVIQNSDNSSITINLNNPVEVKKALMDFQSKLNELPLEIVRLLMEKADNKAPESGANVYLNVNLLFETDYGVPTGRIQGIAVGVHVTNTNKEHRYFYEPSFKSSVPFEGNCDTFMLTNAMPNKPNFPKRLEYGEPFSVHYQILDMMVFKKIYEIDPEATLVAFVNTTLGEVFFSNEYKIKDLVKDEKYIKPNPMRGF